MKKVYARGLNFAAQINSTRKNIKQFTQITQLSGYPIKNLECGYLQSYFFLQNGQMLKNGYLMDSLTCIRQINFYRLFPSLIKVMQKMKFLGKHMSFRAGDEQLTLLNGDLLEQKNNIIEASLNSCRIFLFNNKSQVFGIGQNYFGQLGTKNSITLENTFRKIEITNQKIKKVKCGFQHTIFITESGRAYGCGKADSYQIQPLKMQVKKSQTKQPQVTDIIQDPAIIINSTIIKDAGCGFKYTMFVTENNKLFALGENKFGQCGINPKLYLQIAKPLQIYFPLQPKQTILDIKCGTYHTLILTNFHVYFMGSLQFNQNPFQKYNQNLYSPTIMDLPSRPIKIFANFDRSAIITQDGKCYIFGGKDYKYCGGQSGQLEVLDRWKFDQDSLIGLGFAHTVIYT